VGEDVSYIDAPQVVPHVDHQPILVSADVEDRAAGAEEAGRGKVLPELVWCLVLPALEDPVPGIEGRPGVLILLAKVLQGPSRDDA
jgi:hypothetical protein